MPLYKVMLDGFELEQIELPDRNHSTRLKARQLLAKKYQSPIHYFKLSPVKRYTKGWTCEDYR